MDSFIRHYILSGNFKKYAQKSDRTYQLWSFETKINDFLIENFLVELIQ